MIASGSKKNNIHVEIQGKYYFTGQSTIKRAPF